MEYKILKKLAEENRIKVYSLSENGDVYTLGLPTYLYSNSIYLNLDE